jgi:hypothetical protein
LGVVRSTITIRRIRMAEMNLPLHIEGRAVRGGN